MSGRLAGDVGEGAHEMDRRIAVGGDIGAELIENRRRGLFIGARSVDDPKFAFAIAAGVARAWRSRDVTTTLRSEMRWRWPSTWRLLR